MENKDDGVDALEKLLNGIISAPIKEGNDLLLGELRSKVEEETKLIRNRINLLSEEVKNSRDLIIEENKELAEQSITELTDKINKIDSLVRDASVAAEKYNVKIESEIANHYAKLAEKLQSENRLVIDAVNTSMQNISTAIHENNAHFLAELDNTSTEIKAIASKVVIISEAVKGQYSSIQDHFSTLTLNVNSVDTSIRESMVIASNQSEKIGNEIKAMNTSISSSLANFANGLMAKHTVELAKVQQVATQITWQISLSILNLAGLVGLMVYLTFR